MKVIKKEIIGIQPVFSTNVETVGNYISEGNIINKNCCVDSDYRGETYISLINTSDNYVTVSPGEKIIQGIIYEVGSHVPAEVDDIDKYSSQTERGAGGFGSTGIQ